MSKRKGNLKQNVNQEEEFEQVDLYLIPKSHVEMYRVLRDAVAAEISDFLQSQGYQLEWIFDQDQGEAIFGKHLETSREVTIFLSPNNVSQAQKARDKDQMEKFVLSFLS